MHLPRRLITTSAGKLWAAGSHENAAATAYLDPQTRNPQAQSWHVQKHPKFAESVAFDSVLESPDGSIWFGANIFGLSQQHLGGILRFNKSSNTEPTAWTHYTPHDGPYRSIYAADATSDGNVWIGQKGLKRFDGSTWQSITKPEGLTGWIHDINSTNGKDLWIGTRAEGVYHFDGSAWHHYDESKGLADNMIASIYQAQDSTVWALTHKGISRFDGHSWTTHALPPTLAKGFRYSIASTQSIRQSRDGALWFNFLYITDSNEPKIKTVRYMPDKKPPETQITFARKEIAQPGNTTLTWIGKAQWKNSLDSELQFSYRLNSGSWSSFSPKLSHIFETLPSGNHTFEVKVRDLDFNEDPTPAIVHFTVSPPVYQQSWFLGLMAILFSAIVYQTARVVRRDRHLQESNAALSNANKELFQVNINLETANIELQRDRAVERIRAQVQTMEKAEDFDAVLSVLAEDLNAVGLTFTTCGIDALDDPEDAPTMAHFETTGFRYTAYTIDPKGTVTSEAYHIPAPFPPMSRETIERFIEGQPWQALTEGQNAILEVPISNYGRLRLTSSDRENFTDDEVATLQDFATAIALGYARYLDFQLIQQQTERKSRFLSAISHELRTPLTAIKGYSDNLLEGISGELTERQERGVSRIGSNSIHMLSLVNDLLDIARIEAGRVEVNAEAFNIQDLIIGCCDTVTPLVKPDAQLTHDIADNIGDANTDQGRVRQILINLLSNALKFTEQGEVKVTASKNNPDTLTISVSDTGTGIPQDDLATIFEEFKQVKGSDREHKGTGLGLPITKGFAELLGGSISVESVVGKGSTFTVKIPCVYKEGA